MSGKKITAMALAALMMNMGLVSCSKAAPEEKEQKQTAEEASAPVIMPKLALSLSINRQADAVVPRGWPVIVRAVLASTEGDIELSNPEGGWRELVSLEVTDAGGRVQPWKFTPGAAAEAGGGSLELNPDAPALASWTLDAPENAAPGVYEMFVSVEGSEGKAVRGPHRIEIVEAVPVQWKPEEKFRRLLEAESLAVRGDAEGAVKTLDAFLAEHEGDLDALVLKSVILKESGRGPETLKALNEMLEAFPAGSSPPEELLRERNRLLMESLKGQD